MAREVLISEICKTCGVGNCMRKELVLCVAVECNMTLVIKDCDMKKGR